MIQKATVFVASNGTKCDTIEAAQLQELIALLGETTTPQKVFENADKVIDALTMRATSKPKARKINGGKKTRKVQEPPNAAA